MRILAELDDESFSRLEEKLGMHVRDILKFIVLNNGIIELHVHKKDKAAKEMCKRFKKGVISKVELIEDDYTKEEYIEKFIKNNKGFIKKFSFVDGKLVIVPRSKFAQDRINRIIRRMRFEKDIVSIDWIKANIPFKEEVVINVYVWDKVKNNITDSYEYYVSDGTGNSKVVTTEELEVDRTVKYVITGNVLYDEDRDEIVLVASEVEQHDFITPSKIGDRAELHMYSKMSGISTLTPEEIVMIAKRAGLKAVALADLHNMHAIPEFYLAAKKHGVKPIIGCQMLVVDDVAEEDNFVLDDETYVVLDLETTGFSSVNDDIIEIGAYKVKDWTIIDEFTTFIKPNKLVPEEVKKLTGITDDMLENAPTIDEIKDEFIKFIGDSIIVAHNAQFDFGFLSNKFGIKNSYIDTIKIARVILDKEVGRFNLQRLAKYFSISGYEAHRAKDDARLLVDIFNKMINIAKTNGAKTYKDMMQSNKSFVPSGDVYYITFLARNKTGLKNLYKMVSLSHTKYLYKGVPLLPKNEIRREGLLLGLPLHNSELSQAFEKGFSIERIRNIISYYDYLEVSHLRNYDKEASNKMAVIVHKITQDLNKPVVLVSNACGLHEDDNKAIELLFEERNNKTIDPFSIEDAVLYKNPEDIFKYHHEHLDINVARKILFDNTVKIADMIEDDLEVIKGELHAPDIPEAVENMQNIINERLKELYKGNPPKRIMERLNKEMKIILDNGYAVLYYIAYLVVKDSLKNGYVVGSRGSVGSSFVAYLLGVTEVNPLEPHYVCPNCGKVLFSDELKLDVEHGFDLPERVCECGTVMNTDGHNIPFETFLGFTGDKTPDIDLNLSDEYQSKSHDYVVELFGKDKVIRAGTILTLADKNAFAVVNKKYENESYTEKRKLAKLIFGVKKSTGKHPGGLIIIPKDKEPEDFTPVNYPANKIDNLYTTHFEYEYLHDDLIKLDSLGHQVPTFLKRLEEYSGTNPLKVPFDDKATMSLFSSTDVLGIKLDEINVKVGTLGVPEFNTSFVRRMLEETRPKTFADLIRITGLAHGTNVWTNNAQELIRSGICELKNVIAARDDIMLYLISKGLEPLKAFNIMENVRKGKGLTDEMIKEMRKHGVPEWYIDSCNKIQYLFPKAHAAAYCTMSYRIAYYKAHFPTAFYASYFTLKLDVVSADILLKPINEILNRINELNNMPYRKPKENEELQELEVVYEFMKMGGKFIRPSILKSDSKRFLILSETPMKLLIPLNKVPNMGNKTAESIVIEREKSMFVSKKDFKDRTSINKKQLEWLEQYGSLEDLPDDMQIQLF